MPSNHLKKLSYRGTYFACLLTRLAANLVSSRKPAETKSEFQPLANEQGFVLVATIVLLLIMVIIGISSNTTTNLELQIAGNDKLGKQAFYAADGGTEVGANLVEENVSCPGGFAVQPLTIGTVQVVNRNFALQDDSNFWILDGTGARVSPITPFPSDAIRDIRFPANDAAPHTNLSIYGNTIMSHGNALQMIAGYEGMGKGAASGGSLVMFDIYSQRLDINNAESDVFLLWRHVIGLEGECNY